jgi:hypothetical protein
MCVCWDDKCVCVYWDDKYVIIYGCWGGKCVFMLDVGMISVCL